MLAQWILSVCVFAELSMSCLASGNCGDGWIASRGHCYYVSTSKTNWEDAKAQCEQRDAYLASVLDEAENSFLTTITNLSKADYWLGLLRRDGSKRWMWLDGNNVSYNNWLGNKLEASGNCVRMVSGGQWIVTTCQTSITPGKRPVLYICKQGNKQSLKKNLIGSRTSVGGREGLELILPLVLAAVFIVLVIVVDILAIYYCKRIKSVNITRTTRA